MAATRVYNICRKPSAVMGKRKKTYQSKGTPAPSLQLSGRVMLKFEDEEALLTPEKGDVMVFLSTDSDPKSAFMGAYYDTGYAGFLKTDVWDGKKWTPLDIQDFFPDREHYFRKSERPIDTYGLCKPLLEAHAGAALTRTYREHYVLTVAEEE